MEPKPPEPIKTDLFRFVTIRTPQLIGVDKKKLGFIYHPNPEKSFFLKDVHTDNIDEARRAVRKNVDSFKAVMTYEEIVEAVPEMYEFASWLTRYRSSLNQQDVAKYIGKVSVLSEEKLFKIWDNLFYQALKRKNPPVRQACIQLIIANNFVSVTKDPGSRKFAEEVIQTPRDPLPPSVERKLDLFLRRLANAKVVMPKAFSVKRRSTEAPHRKHEFDVSPGAIELMNQHLLSKTAHRIDNYNKIKRELRFGVKSLNAPEKDLAALPATTGENPNSLSFETKSFLKANPTKGVSLRMAEDLIDEKVKEENRKTIRAINGHHTAKRSNASAMQNIEPYSFVLTAETVESDLEVVLTLFTGYPGAFLRTTDYEISFVENHPIHATSAAEIPSHKLNSLTLRLFPKQTLDTQGRDNFNLRGTFILNNSKTVLIEVDGATNSVIHGQGEVEDNLPEEIPTLEEGRLFGVSRVGIGVFRKVEQEVCCYVPGEVSRIENILAGEYKERTTRSLVSTETIEEDTTEVEVENQSDTVSTNRNELQTEIANVLTRDTSIGTGASLGVSGKTPGGSLTVTADGYFDFATANSSSVSDTEAQSYAQEITNSALERVLQKTTQKRTSRILSEYEESNRHGFDNRKGSEHVTGVYRWIDIIYTNRVINYGKRLMFEFLIPEPAKFYKLALERKAKAKSKKNGSGNQLEEPITLTEQGINSPTDINIENYLGLGRTYGVTLEDPITPEDETITQSFGPSDDPDGDHEPNAKECSYQFRVDFNAFGDFTKYSAYEVSAAYNFDYHYTAAENKTYFVLKIHNNTTRYDKDNLVKSDGTSESKSRNKNDSKTVPLPDLKNSLSLTVDMKNVYNFSINLGVKLRVDEQEVINWQNRVYDALMKAYDDMVEQYETEQQELEAEAKEEAEDVEPSSSNPEFNRTVEQRELQRIAIEMLTKPFGVRMGEDFYFPDQCKIPKVEQTRWWEVYSSHVKFFEQAFDWSLIAYLFYPYYWADECDWVDLLQTKDASDPIFEAFLQSGMARVVVPVRRGFEEAVDYYMETGDIWNGGGLVLDTDDDLYLSIDEELLEVEGFVANEWQTRVPTTLTIVQGRSVFLEDEGLPCCGDLEESGVDTLLRPSTAMLGSGVKE